jgi:hypothetical protein
MSTDTRRIAMISSPPMTSTLVALRAAYHPEATPKYDRVVFEFTGPMPLIQIEYVNELIGDGSGLPMPIAGNAIIHVWFTPAQAHNGDGNTTSPDEVTYNLPNVKEVVRAGDFEGVVSYGIGLDHKAELRIITLASPSRVVIDVIL